MILRKGNVNGITLIAALGGLLFGYDTAVISGTVNALDQYFVVPLGLSELEASARLGTLVASALLGCIIGGAIASVLSERFGPRRILRLSAVLFAVSALGSAVPEFGFAAIGEGAHLDSLFVFYRIIGGIGVGLASVCSPMYIAEIAPAAIRGRLVSYNQFAIVTGILAAYFSNYGITVQGDEAWNLATGWRIMFAVEAAPALLFFWLLKAVPESPRWLILRGEREAGHKVLEDLYGAGYAARVGLSVLQQFVGINVVLYYAPEIFRSMGLGADTAMLQTVVVGVVNLVFTIVAIRWVDHHGRRPLMIAGACAMGVSMLVLGTALYLQVTGMLALVAMLVFVASFSFSWGPVCWVLLSEIFPNRIRAKGLAVAVAAQWVANYLVSASFPVLDRHPEAVPEVENFHASPIFLNDAAGGTAPWLELFIDYWNRPGSWARMPAELQAAQLALGWKMYQEVRSVSLDATPFAEWQLPMPLTLLYGEKTTASAKAMVAELAAVNPHARVVMLPGVNHMAVAVKPAVVWAALAAL